MIDFNPTRRTILRQLTAATVLAALGEAEATTTPRIFNAKKYGALGDGQTLDTAAIQRAIDDAARAGGGTILLPPGQYVSGTLRLKSNVTLHLDRNATLLGSLNPIDYQLVEPFIDGVGTPRGYALLAAVDAHHIAVTGFGTIDGRGAELQAAGGKVPSARPFLVLWLRSTGINVQDVALRNSSAWTMHIFQCANVSVSHVSIHSTGLANNDGIDIDSSRRVHIDSCTIESDDDAICLKTTSSQPCRDITVTRCSLTTRCAAFKIGTESAADFSAIRIADCHVLRANLGAIKLLSVDGANISNVLAERIHVDEADTPIFLRLGERGRTYRPGDAARPAGTLRGITLRDITVQRAHRIGILISGLPGHTIDDITLERVSIQISDSPTTQLPPEPAELPAAYPEVRMFGTHLPASGLYARHLRNLRLTDVTIATPPSDTRPERVIDDD